MRLNGWHRIGVVASVAWATIGFLAFAAQIKAPDTSEKGIAKHDRGHNGRPQSDSQYEDQSTQKAPSVVVHVETPAAEAHSADSQDDKEAQRKLVEFTGWLAVATVSLVVVGGGQVYLLIRQEEILRGARDEIHRQAGHIERQADLMNKSLILQFRPRLDIRRIFIVPGTKTPTEGSQDSTSLQVNFIIGNRGGSPAHITECHFSLVTVDNSLPQIPTHLDQARPGSFSLAPGEEKEMSIKLNEDLTKIRQIIGDAGLSSGQNNPDRMYFYGHVRYTDEVGIFRTLSTCRDYDNAFQRFKAKQDADYEYDD